MSLLLIIYLASAISEWLLLSAEHTNLQLIDNAIKNLITKVQKTYVFSTERMEDMLTVKSMDARDNFKNLCKKVFDGETLIISRPKNQNVVMLSETEYNEIIKAKRNADYLAMLDKSTSKAETGGFVTKTITKLETLE